MRDTRHEILHFWFEESEPHQWFQTNEDFDALIRERFFTMYEMARDDLCVHWGDDAHGALALCLLLDQFPRNMFRGAPAMFATDDTALLFAKQAVKNGFHTLFPHEQRFFFFLPFEHSEKMSDQERNMALFETTKEQNPIAYAYAKRHYEVIERFGRFPHRNEILGRDSTPEEQAYLKEHGGF